MAQMMGKNRKNERSKIYLINRDVKVHCYHHHCVHGTDLKEICKWAKERIKNEKLIGKYLEMITNDDRYLYDEDEADLEDKKSDASWDKCEIEEEENKL